ncbi:hypothetical protein J4419_02665 [Candidatus Woesearchaeota archaeon]|nr:hypothetical protein [Candidatus Woesearchaeota archaeon]
MKPNTSYLAHAATAACGVFVGLLWGAGLTESSDKVRARTEQRWRIDQIVDYKNQFNDLTTLQLGYEYRTKESLDGKPERFPVGINQVTLFHDTPPYGSLDAVTLLERNSVDDPWPVVDRVYPSDPHFGDWARKYDTEHQNKEK